MAWYILTRFDRNTSFYFISLFFCGMSFGAIPIKTGLLVHRVSVIIFLDKQSFEKFENRIWEAENQILEKIAMIWRKRKPVSSLPELLLHLSPLC